MLNVLISIKPQYVKKIVSKKKLYEYRKKIFIREVDRIYIYSSSPQKKIIGYFKYDGYLHDTPEKLWQLTSDKGGVEAKDYFSYFSNVPLGYALKINKIYLFDRPLDPRVEIDGFYPPQSFQYLNRGVFSEKLCSLV